jgi:predicted phage tail protein
MSASGPRLAKPLYEGLPWLYIVCGVLALVASYFARSAFASGVLGVPGFAVLLGGIVVLLRRRDYRRMRARYTNPDVP